MDQIAITPRPWTLKGTLRIHTLSIFLSGFLSDRLGRRYAALTGAVTTCVGAAIMTGARGNAAFAMMIIGRIIAGFGNAILSTSVPLYQRFVKNPRGLLSPP